MKRIFAFVAIFLMLAGGFGGVVANSASAQHVDPKTTSGIPFEGAPWYLEDFVTGGVIADYGSHYGLKACVGIKPNYDADNSFVKTTHYSAMTSYTNGMIDRSNVFLRTSNGDLLSPSDSRALRFNYWGWSETATAKNLMASASTVTLDVDTFLTYLVFTNTGNETLTAAPGIRFDLAFNEVKNENMMLSFIPSSTLSYALENDTANTAAITNIAQEFNVQLPSQGKLNAPLNLASNLSTIRVIAPKFEIASVSSANIPFSSYTHTILGEEVTIQPGETYETYYVTGADQASAIGQTDSLLGSAAKRATEGRDRVGDTPALAVAEQMAEWQSFFGAMPSPHADNAEHQELYYLGASAIRMGIYAPRNAMIDYCSVPCKPHFNFFWCWDTPFQALGQTEFGQVFGIDGPEMAERNMYNQFTGQDPATGMIYIVVDDEFTCVSPIYTNPAVHGWTMQQVYEMDSYRDSPRAVDFLDNVFGTSVDYLNWWGLERDTNSDGLYEYNSAMETGWDDTPRYAEVNPSDTNTGGFIPTIGIDAIDLNSWIYIYMKNLAKWAEILGDSESANSWRAEADALAARVDDMMWCEEDSAWYDLNHMSGSYEFVKVTTPAMWFPAFAELSNNEERIKRVIEEHVLNEQEFFGQYPIPTVAYNSYDYNHEADGYYWRGQIWMITAYITLETLYKYGYEEEAAELRTRLMDMMANKGGIYETYDSATGEVGWGSNGVGDPSCFQFGWSSTFTMKMMMERYQRTRFIMSDDDSFSGHIKEAKMLATDETFYTVDSGEYEVPYVEVSCENGTLENSDTLTIMVLDPYGNLQNGEVSVTITDLTFDATIGHTYEASLASQSVVDLAGEKNGARQKTPGFDFLASLGVLCVVFLASARYRKKGGNL